MLLKIGVLYNGEKNENLPTPTLVQAAFGQERTRRLRQARKGAFPHRRHRHGYLVQHD